MLFSVITLALATRLEKVLVNACIPVQWTVLKALDDIVSGTMSIVSIAKTKRCSGLGETIADTIAKGEITGLDRLGLIHATWVRPSRVLMD